MVEYRTVDPIAAGSNPVTHPSLSFFTGHSPVLGQADDYPFYGFEVLLVNNLPMLAWCFAFANNLWSRF
jgi:hypothetical protein